MASNYKVKYEEGCFYHLYNKASNEKQLFYDNRDYDFYKRKFQKYFSKIFNIYAYCLMPNHFHFLVQVKNKEEIRKNYLNFPESKAIKRFLANGSSVTDLISDQFRRLNSSYSLMVRNKHNLAGQLFLSKSKNPSVDEKRLLDLICYIHANPRKAGIVDDFKYEYSSYFYLVEKTSEQLLSVTQQTIDLFGSKEEFVKYHKEYMMWKEME